MTDVRRTDRAHRASSRPVTAAAATRVAQVRLRADEVEALHQVMRTLQLGSTSDALREGLRLLAREASEVGAAADIRAFYPEGSAPLPDGVASATDAELAAADSAQW